MEPAARTPPWQAPSEPLAQHQEPATAIVEALEVHGGDIQRRWAEDIRRCCLEPQYWSLEHHPALEGCGNRILDRYRCHRPACPRCREIDGARARERIEELIRRAGPKRVKLLTISPKNCRIQDVPEVIRRLGRLIRWLRGAGKLHGRLYFEVEETWGTMLRGGVWVFEISPGRLPGRVHVHCHAAVECPEFVPGPKYQQWKRAIKTKWRKLMTGLPGKTIAARLDWWGAREHLKRAPEDVLARELAKYLAKPWLESKPDLLAEILPRLKGVRRLRTFGSWYPLRRICPRCQSEHPWRGRICPACAHEFAARPICPACRDDVVRLLEVEPAEGETGVTYQEVLYLRRRGMVELVSDEWTGETWEEERLPIPPERQWPTVGARRFDSAPTETRDCGVWHPADAASTRAPPASVSTRLAAMWSESARRDRSGPRPAGGESEGTGSAASGRRSNSATSLPIGTHRRIREPRTDTP